MRKVVVKDRCSSCSHTGRIFVGWAYEKMISDRLTHLILVLEAIIYILPIGVLQFYFYFQFEI